MFITTALERGIDVAVVAGWQGHRDGGKLLLTTYNHARQSHGDRLAKLMTLEVPENVVSMAATARQATMRIRLVDLKAFINAHVNPPRVDQEAR